MGKGDNPNIFNFGFWNICRIYSNIGPLVICSYYLVLVLCIFNKILKVLFFSGKIVTCLGNSFYMQKSLLKNIFGR